MNPSKTFSTELTNILVRHATNKYSSESTFIKELKDHIYKLTQEAYWEGIQAMTDEMKKDRKFIGENIMKLYNDQEKNFVNVVDEILKYADNLITGQEI